MQDRQFLFAAFRLDTASQQLWRGAELIPLRPKLFAVLRCLIERAGQLVTRDELRASVWPNTVVSESVLRGAIRELRDTLADDATAARFIETYPHRGYRFVAPVTIAEPPPTEIRAAPVRTAEGAPPRNHAIRIGRDAELARLHESLRRAMQGARQVVFVTGEPGIGKTTLVDTFLAAAADAGDVLTARGQCVEQYGAGEAYLPVLDALGQLCRQHAGQRVIDGLSRYAPTWLAQMPGLLGDAELEAVQRRAQGTTRERMLRELAEGLEAVTAHSTLVLVLEDLHWTDYSTLDLISVLAQRRAAARLLLVGTYRPADVLASGHPLKGLKEELRVRGQCEELPLPFFTDVEVADYLTARFPKQQLPADLPSAIHRSTEGNPLFVVNVVDYWLSQRVLVETAGEWQLTGRVGDAAAGVPDSLRQMIEKQLGRLTPEQRRLIEVASVAGAEFSTAVVAAGLGEPGERVEELCEGLAQGDQFLLARATELSADGMVLGRYGFRHALYQQVLYERVAAARRARLHRRIGEWEEQAYGPQVNNIAAELAMHFDRGHDAERAVRHLTHAGENALRRSAHPEAISVLTRGLELLQTLPETPDRIAQELSLQATLGTALAVTKGYAAPEVARAQRRAFELCQQMNEAPQVFPVLAGLWGFHFLRAEMRTAMELAAQLSRIADTVQLPVLLLWAHAVQGMTLSTLGELPAAMRHLEEGMTHYDPQLHGPERTSVGAQDPKVTCLAYAAWTLWRLGYPDQARRRRGEAIGLAHQLSHPFSLAFALDFGGSGVGMFLRDVAGVDAYAETLLKVCHEQGFPYWSGWGDFRKGWAMTQTAEVVAGIERMRKGMNTVQSTGGELSRSYMLAQLAEVHGTLKQQREALDLLAQARSLIEHTGERWYEAEIYRIEGEVLLQTDPGGRRRESGKKTKRSAAAHATTDQQHAAEACFLAAIEVAQRQQAKSWELRAATSLSRLWQQQGKREQARELLGSVYAWFTEGFRTADVRDARHLLAKLSSQSR